jgi:chromosome segregation ATPase
MVMSPDDTPSLGEVVERFRSSERTLAELQERLKTLTFEEDAAIHAIASIRDAADVLRNTAAKVTAIVEQLEASQAAVVESLAAAQQFLEGTDLTDVLREVQELRRESAALRHEVVASMTELVDRIPQVDAARADAEAAREELQALKARIPQRTRRKLGL